jgi:hypothetical protein
MSLCLSDDSEFGLSALAEHPWEAGIPDTAGDGNSSVLSTGSTGRMLYFSLFLCLCFKGYFTLLNFEFWMVLSSENFWKWSSFWCGCNVITSVVQGQGIGIPKDC